MQRVSAVRGLAALTAVLLLFLLPGCGGGNTSNNTVTSLSLTPTTISLNQGGVVQLSVTAQNSSGTAVAADISFTSSNNAVATVSSGGLVCGGVWDADIINCNVNQGQAGVGQITITATATAFNVSTTAIVYVHEPVNYVTTTLGAGCTSMGQPINVTGQAFSTTAPGCSKSSPCNITSTVGPFTYNSNNTAVAASSAGIESTFSSTVDSPTYTSGGTINGSSGQTCNLSSFNGVTNATATVKLTSQNTIASGTQLTITSPGYGATVAPTTATLSNGTATCSGTANVITALTSGVLTAETPGATTVFSSVSGVNSVGAAYLTCPVASILVEGVSGGNSFTVSPPNTQGLGAIVYDTSGTLVTPTLTWGSSSIAVATVVASTTASNQATATAVAGGTASITATCSYPECNIGVNPEYGQNVVTITVPPGINTTVYAASSNSKMLVPISTTTNTAGTAITLPNYPNSIIADPAGAAVYLGSSGGLMKILTGSTTVSLLPANGTILAISPDGNYLLISDNVDGNLNYFSIINGTNASIKDGYTANSSAYTPDAGYNEWVNATQLGVGFPTGFLNAFTPSSAPNWMDISAAGGLTYITSATGAQVLVYSTCNQTQIQTLAATAPTFIKALPNGAGAVAVDPPSIDVLSTPSPVSSGCPITTPSAINGYNLGVGSFTAQQLLVSSDSVNAWVLPNLPEVIDFNVPNLTPTTIPLAGGATPLYGSLVPNGSQLWVGASDNKVHEIFSASQNDGAQVAVNLTDANGNITVPNLVTVLP